MAVAWRSFSEMREKYSPAEIAFETRRRTIGLFAGPILFIILILLPAATFPGMTRLGQVVLAMTVWTIVWWITEPIPIPATALIPFVFLVITGIMPMNNVYAVLGHENSWLMIGAFIIVGAMVDQGLARRFALKMLSSSWIGTSPTRMIFVFLLVTAILSAVMSNIPVTMLLLVVGLGIADSLKASPEGNLRRNFTLGSAYAAQAGGVMTPIGATSPNFLMISLIGSLLGVRIYFGDWMLWGVPFGIVMFIILFLYFRVVVKPEVKQLSNTMSYAKEELKKMGPMARGEWNALFALILALVLWLVPSGIAGVFGSRSEMATAWNMYLQGSAVAVMCAMLLFLLPVNWKERKFTVTWGQAVKNVEWGVIILVASGLLIGNAMNQPSVGLMKWMANGLSLVIGGANPWVAVFGMVVIGVILTQFLPNVPCIGLLIPIAVPVAIAVGANPVAMALTVGIACQQSYALPISAPQMAIAYGSGNLKITEFLRVGTLLSIIAIPVTAFLMYFMTSMIYTTWTLPK